MPPLRLQFTLRGIFAATFWAAVSMMAWMAAFKAVDQGPIHPLVFAVAGLFCIFAAIGALFGRTLDGFVMGVGAIVLSGVVILFLTLVGLLR